MKKYSETRYFLIRMDGLLFGPRLGPNWCLTTSPYMASQFSISEAMAALRKTIPMSEWFLWALQPVSEMNENSSR